MKEGRREGMKEGGRKGREGAHLMGRFSYASIVVWFFPTRFACMITNPSSATLKAAVSTKVMNVSRKLRAQQGRCVGGVRLSAQTSRAGSCE
jgi:hypothetical protein